MNSERILPVLIVALVLFFQFVVPLLRRRMGEEVAPPDENEEAVAPEGAVVRSPGVARIETQAPMRVERRGPVRRTPPPVAPPLAATARRTSPLGSIADVRRAIVLMTILGPCRAADGSDAHGVR